jgi:hypothetical protein
MKNFILGGVLGLMMGSFCLMNLNAQTATPSRQISQFAAMQTSVAYVQTQQVNHAASINAVLTQVPRYAVAGTPAVTAVPTAY